ncbi:hypothetical protein COCSUDRAFT_32032 [Coccomyxa subellipsoidea C-169]|uniref:Secreted protein n=1 Tax=Coccomyxa subellipsoidea (strain C-169) TaxID=574566 RepID=I0ZA58_COCSC|nr:hypothetical protein COCSUDRAFT_32032 [Coccomyxa subellipsoidea C-169]EIE27527.1 hypothetical protein COCSUDRAFT_32032 [Coccomyxa subellipsoidea C-169]|eukprot:XP_005652071.1 hypothetical protein COCSUDRAFT_32032 [Coccomyxa subellipsoidea C-169]
MSAAAPTAAMAAVLTANAFAAMGTALMRATASTPSSLSFFAVFKKCAPPDTKAPPQRAVTAIHSPVSFEIWRSSLFSGPGC